MAADPSAPLEALTINVDPLAKQELEHARQRYAELHARHSAVLRERDAAQLKAERLDDVIALYERTREFLPIVGVTCDVDKCKSAIGLVGMRLANVDDVVPAMRVAAIAAGWTCTDGVKYTCPSCKRGNKP